MSSHRVVGKNIAFQYTLQIAKYIFPFITLPYLTRALGPDAYAVRAYVLSAMTFLQVFLDYGFNSYGTKSIANHIDDLLCIKQETTTIMMLRALLCVIGALILIPAITFVPILNANPLYTVIAYIAICFKATLPDFIFQGFQQMSIITKRYVGSQAVAIVLMFVFVHSASDLLWIPVLDAIAALIAFLWSWENVLRVMRINFVAVSRKHLRTIFKESTLFFLSNAATTIFSAFTTIMIGIFITVQAEISYWSIAMTAISAIQSLYTPITNSLYPHMVQNRDYRFLKQLLVAGMIACTIGCVLYALLSKTIMLILGGAEYLPGSHVIALTTPVLWFSYPAMLLGFPVLAATDHVGQLTASSLISATVQLFGLIALAVCGVFTLVNVAVLRCVTEAVLCVCRAGFCVHDLKTGGSLQ